MDVSALREAGLTEGETKVYLSLLELGPSTTGPIIEKSGIARSIAYQILEKLMQKGLVSYITREKTRYFEAAEPYRILDYIEERQKRLDSNKSRIEALIPALKSLKKSGDENDVKVYKGFRGIMTVHEKTYDALKKGEGYYYMNVPAFQFDSHHAYWMKDHERRAKAGILCRLLFHPSTDRRILQNRNGYKGVDARYMHLGIDPPVSFFGYKGVAAIFIPSAKPVTIEIANREIAHAFHAYFEAFWKLSEPFRG